MEARNARSGLTDPARAPEAQRSERGHLPPERRGWGFETGFWRTTLVAALAIGLVAAEGIAYARRYIRTAPAASATAATEYATAIAKDKGLFRVAPMGRGALTYGRAAAMNLQIISGYEPYNLSHYQQYLDMLQTARPASPRAVVWTDVRQVQRWDLLNALGVKYVLAAQNAPPPGVLPADPRLELVGQFPRQRVNVLYKGERETDVTVYRNPLAKERAFCPGRILAVPDHEAALRAVTQVSLDDVALVETRAPDALHASGCEAGQARLEVVGARDGALEVDVAVTKPTFVVISEIWHPGWQAYLDGQLTPLFRTDIALMGLRAPAGRHHLSLNFRPLHFRTSAYVSFAAAFMTILAGLALVLRHWRQRLRKVGHA